MWKEIWHKSQKEIKNKIREYLATKIPIQGFLQINQSQPSWSQSLKSIQVNQASQKSTEEIIVADATPPSNISAQKKAAEVINTTNIKFANFNRFIILLQTWRFEII